MLTPFHSAELSSMLNFPFGMRLVTFEGRLNPVLLVKAPKEAILAAKLCHGFKVYIVPLSSEQDAPVCLVSAFFDDADEPLMLTTPLFDDADSHALKQGLVGQFDVHFFNELNHELLAYTTNSKIPESAWHLLSAAKLPPLDLGLARSVHVLAQQFMSLRDLHDDEQAIAVELVTPIFPEDVFIMDVRPHLNAHQASAGFRHTTLERDEPGLLQELDIIGLLRRVFRPDQIFHGPLRVTDRKEIADVVVVTDSRVLLVQAKDSPNNSQTLGNTVLRKRATSVKRLAKAAGQARGAVRYVRTDSEVLRMLVGGTEVNLPLAGRSLFSLVVVKELFNDRTEKYDPLLLELAKTTSVPCAALDYPELHQYTAHLNDEEQFFGALERVYRFAMQNGTFPRLRFGLI